MWPFVAPQSPVSNVGDFSLPPGCAEVFALMRFHIASVGSCLSTFRDLECLTIEDVTDDVSGNLGKQPSRRAA